MSVEDEDRQTSARLAKRLLESSGTEGVYYVVRFPTRWRLYSFSREHFGDLRDADAWRRFVIDDLSESWAAILHRLPQELKAQLEPFPKGFPRGRVERVGLREYTIFHGDDLAETGITAKGIEQTFELGNSAVKWSLDPHERQQPEQRQALNRILAQ